MNFTSWEIKCYAWFYFVHKESFEFPENGVRRCQRSFIPIVFAIIDFYVYLRFPHRRGRSLSSNMHVFFKEMELLLCTCYFQKRFISQSISKSDQAIPTFLPSHFDEIPWAWHFFARWKFQPWHFFLNRT